MDVHKGTSIEKALIRCAILCCACDLPAGRKVCGFVGFNATLGCSKCFKKFTGSVGCMNYSGFDRSSWPVRTVVEHRANVQLLRQCKTKTELAKKVSQLGCRYLVLLELPYFDPCRMLVIDSMHNLFLGSGKQMLNLWLENNVLSKKNYQTIQESVDSFVLPSDVGRIPHKIFTGFSGFTADQFKNWITIFSIPSLFGTLEGEHFECWRHFVLACRILCKRSLSLTDISLADALLMKFCKRVQRIYGESKVTPNMHLHAHLKECILDYGPAYEFRLFSFERYNGILGNQPTNNHLIEPQLMQRFLENNSAYAFQFPEEFSDEFTPHCQTQARVTGSVSDTLIDHYDKAVYTLPTKSKYAVFDEVDLDLLKTRFCKLKSIPESADIPSKVFQKFFHISFNGKSMGYSASGQNSSSSCNLLAEWNVNLYGSPPTGLPQPENPRSLQRPVKLQHLARVSFSVRETVEHIVLAVVSWYHPHPNQHALGKPAEPWCPNLSEDYGLHSFIPIDNIVCRCAHCLKCVQDELSLVVVPLIE